jgi:hypothetical protein
LRHAPRLFALTAGCNGSNLAGGTRRRKRSRGTRRSLAKEAFITAANIVIAVHQPLVDARAATRAATRRNVQPAANGHALDHRHVAEALDGQLAVNLEEERPVEREGRRLGLL